MGETILISCITCLLALVITTVFNWVLNRPKQKKKEKEKEQKELDAKLQAMEDRMNNRFDEVVQLRADERKACGQDHKIVMDKLAQIQDSDKLQMEGLQAVIKNDLKIRYLKWIKLKHAPIDAKDDLEKMYQVYHKLGANGVMDSLREQFLELPETAPKKKSKSSSDVELEVDKEEEEDF